MTRQIAMVALVALPLSIQLASAQAVAPRTAPSGGATREASMTQLPPIKRLPTPKAVVDEHLDAINHCDWTRLMAQYPDDVEFFLPGGQVVKGREQVAELFRGFVKPVKEGGLCGLKFTAEHTLVVGDTINVAWVGTADFLAEPYRGADAYITKNGLMQAQVTTFDRAAMKLK